MQLYEVEGFIYSRGGLYGPYKVQLGNRKRQVDFFKLISQSPNRKPNKYINSISFVILICFLYLFPYFSVTGFI